MNEEDRVLSRPFGFWTATALVMGGMIGSGIFLLPISMAPLGWTGVLAWGISIAGALCIAYAMCCLATALPHETGVVAVTGAVLGELPGVLVGWSYWVSVWAAVAAIGIAATSYLSELIPALNRTPLTGGFVSVAIIWSLTASNLAGAAFAGRLQVLTTVLKIMPLLAVIGVLAWLGLSDRQVLPPVPPAAGLVTGLTAAITLTLFPLLGFEAAGVAAERVRDPGRTIMRATMAGTIMTGLLYLFVCSGIVLTLPLGEISASSAPFSLFIDTYVGRGAGLVTAAFAAIAAIGALNGWVLLQGEVPLGMARAGLLPRWFSKVSDRDVPVRVLVLSSTLASLLVLSNSSARLSGVFKFAALVTTASSLWLYLAICVAALARRIAIVPATFGLAFTLWAMMGAGIDASGLSLALMLTAIPIYLLRSRGRAAEQSAE